MTSSFTARVRTRTPGQRAQLSPFVEALGPGPWLVLAPHDDDVVIGMGMAVCVARSLGIDVHVAVATDGALGYVHEHERATLVHTRAQELAEACRTLGVPAQHIHSLGFADGALAMKQGCLAPGEPKTLAQTLVRLLRTLRPSTFFVCAPGDVHPDHRVCASESEIACVWAASKIWLEYGEPSPMPRSFYYACYAPFASDPTLEVEANEAAFAAKIAALRSFVSQGVVEPMLSRLQEAGPFEYFLEARRLEYRPNLYRPLFNRE